MQPIKSVFKHTLPQEGLPERKRDVSCVYTNTENGASSMANRPKPTNDKFFMHRTWHDLELNKSRVK